MLLRSSWSGVSVGRAATQDPLLLIGKPLKILTFVLYSLLTHLKVDNFKKCFPHSKKFPTHQKVK